MSDAILRPGAVAQLIVAECELADEFGQSACLACQHRVMSQSKENEVTLFCRALFRDLQISITRCTAYVPD